MSCWIFTPTCCCCRHTTSNNLLTKLFEGFIATFEKQLESAEVLVLGSEEAAKEKKARRARNAGSEGQGVVVAQSKATAVAPRGVISLEAKAW